MLARIQEPAWGWDGLERKFAARHVQAPMEISMYAGIHLGRDEANLREAETCGPRTQKEALMTMRTRLYLAKTVHF